MTIGECEWGKVCISCLPPQSDMSDYNALHDGWTLLKERKKTFEVVYWEVCQNATNK